MLSHDLPQVSIQLSEGPVAAASIAPLVSLQSLLHDEWGEAYFNRGRQTPLLFLSVLLHSLQVLPSASGCFRLLPSASACFWLLRSASDCVRRASECF